MRGTQHQPREERKRTTTKKHQKQDHTKHKFMSLYFLFFFHFPSFLLFFSIAPRSLPRLQHVPSPPTNFGCSQKRTTQQRGTFSNTRSKLLPFPGLLALRWCFARLEREPLASGFARCLHRNDSQSGGDSTLVGQPTLCELPVVYRIWASVKLGLPLFVVQANGFLR